MFRFAVVLFLLVAGCSRGSSVWDEYNTACQICIAEDRIGQIHLKQVSEESHLAAGKNTPELEAEQKKYEEQLKRIARAIKYRKFIESKLPTSFNN
jgi:Na+-translocating ferredoxin:NAD+ oxidoreductase RNF subunit RnfB